MNDFFSERQVTGRTDYVCQHCRREIPRGTKHMRVASCSLGALSSHRAHLDCHAVATGAEMTAPSTVARSA